MADRPDCQGVSPLHLVTSRKLNYCNLVFTSYQRYRERLACVQGSLGGVVDEKNDDEKLQEDEKNMVEQVEDLDEGYGIERVESKDKRYSLILPKHLFLSSTYTFISIISQFCHFIVLSQV